MTYRWMLKDISGNHRTYHFRCSGRQKSQTNRLGNDIYVDVIVHVWLPSDSPLPVQRSSKVTYKLFFSLFFWLVFFHSPLAAHLDCCRLASSNWRVLGSNSSAMLHQAAKFIVISTGSCQGHSFKIAQIFFFIFQDDMNRKTRARAHTQCVVVLDIA